MEEEEKKREEEKKNPHQMISHTTQTYFTGIFMTTASQWQITPACTRMYRYTATGSDSS
jgi:hypothetical protein